MHALFSFNLHFHFITLLALTKSTTYLMPINLIVIFSKHASIISLPSASFHPSMRNECYVYMVGHWMNIVRKMNAYCRNVFIVKSVSVRMNVEAKERLISTVVSNFVLIVLLILLEHLGLLQTSYSYIGTSLRWI